MSKFAIEKVNLIENNEKGIDEKIPFYKLFINKRCDFDKFYSEIYNSNLKPQLIQIITRLKTISEGNQHTLPKQKFHQLKRDKSDKFIDYEIKTKNLRLYFFKDNDSRIIVLGGKKKEQVKDLDRMRKIKKEYFKNKP